MAHKHSALLCDGLQEPHMVEDQALVARWLAQTADASTAAGAHARRRRKQKHPEGEGDKASLSALSSDTESSRDTASLSASASVSSFPVTRSCRLLDSDEAEPWQRFPHLRTGYRPAGSTHWECLASMFGARGLHNEFFNAWTMVASFLAGLWLLWQSLAETRPATWADASPFIVLFLAQAAHFPVSVGYHTFMAVSAATAHRWRRADLSLVLLMNVGSTYALAYFTLGWYLTIAVTLLAGLCAGRGMASIMSLQRGQALNRSQMIRNVAGTAAGYYAVIIYRGIAAAAAAARAAAAAVPAVASAAAAGLADATGSRQLLMASHSTGSAAAENLQEQVFPAWMHCPELWVAVGLVVCHGIGATCYALHWPQRQFPRVFDRCGFSHNLMHVLCFAIYVCGYPYLAVLYAKRQEWFE